LILAFYTLLTLSTDFTDGRRAYLLSWLVICDLRNAADGCWARMESKRTISFYFVRHPLVPFENVPEKFSSVERGERQPFRAGWQAWSRQGWSVVGPGLCCSFRSSLLCVKSRMRRFEQRQ